MSFSFVCADIIYVYFVFVVVCVSTARYRLFDVCLYLLWLVDGHGILHHVQDLLDVFLAVELEVQRLAEVLLVVEGLLLQIIIIIIVCSPLLISK